MRGVAALNPTGRSYQAMLGWAYGLEDKEGGRGKSEKGSQEEESCERGGKEEENIGIFPTASEWGARERSHPFERHWRVPDRRIQVQRGHLQRQGKVLALQES